MSSEYLQRLNDERTFDSLENYYITKKQNKKENLWVLIFPGDYLLHIYLHLALYTTKTTSCSREDKVNPQTSACISILEDRF